MRDERKRLKRNDSSNSAYESIDTMVLSEGNKLVAEAGNTQPALISDAPRIVKGVDMTVVDILSHAHAYHHAINKDKDGRILTKAPLIEGYKTVNPRDMWYELQQPKTMKYNIRHTESQSHKKKVLNNMLIQNENMLRREYNRRCLDHNNNTGRSKVPDIERERSRVVHYQQYKDAKDKERLDKYSIHSQRCKEYLSKAREKDRERAHKMEERMRRWHVRIQPFLDDNTEDTLYDVYMRKRAEKKAALCKKKADKMEHTCIVQALKDIDSFDSELSHRIAVTNSHRNKLGRSKSLKKVSSVQRIEGSIKTVSIHSMIDLNGTDTNSNGVVGDDITSEVSGSVLEGEDSGDERGLCPRIHSCT